MPVTVAMYDKAFEEIGEQLNALGLDITVHTFGRDGKSNGRRGRDGAWGS